MRFGFVMGEIGHGLRRNVSMVISVILVTFISLTFVGTASLLQLQIGQMKNYWYDRAQVAVYLCTEVSPGDVCPQGEASADLRATIEEKLQSPVLKPYIKEYFFENHQQAFDKIKATIAKDVTLAYPDYTQGFEIYTDSSKLQLGAVITQNNRPLAFFSRKLSPAQQKYSVTEQELLAIVETLKEFKGMLWGQPMTVYTDH